MIQKKKKKNARKTEDKKWVVSVNGLHTLHSFHRDNVMQSIKNLVGLHVSLVRSIEKLALHSTMMPFCLRDFVVYIFSFSRSCTINFSLSGCFLWNGEERKQNNRCTNPNCSHLCILTNLVKYIRKSMDENVIFQSQFEWICKQYSKRVLEWEREIAKIAFRFCASI